MKMKTQRTKEVCRLIFAVFAVVLALTYYQFSIQILVVKQLNVLGSIGAGIIIQLIPGFSAEPRKNIVPTILIGLFFLTPRILLPFLVQEQIEEAMVDILICGACAMLTAYILFMSRKGKKHTDQKDEEL